MNDLSAESLQAIYFSVIGVFTLVLAWNGYRQGVFRQLMTLAAIVCAYAMAYYGGGMVAPLFEFLQYPKQITWFIGATVAGLVTFIAIRTLRAIFFKRTRDQQSQGVRLSYGILGAAIGVVFGGILLILSGDAIRLLGAIANEHVKMADRQKKAAETVPGVPLHELPVEEPNILVRGLAKLGSALDSGSTGKFFKKVDPVPTKVYANIAKLALMVSNPEALDRFLSYPGVERLATHPKLIALRSDPGVSELLATNSYLKLLRHEKVVSLASDPDFAAEIKAVDFEKALDASLKKDATALER